MTVQIEAVVATDMAGGIGKNGTIPWKCSNDMREFKGRTMGSPVIMGRKTWESLGYKALPGRMNIVVTKTYPKGAEYMRRTIPEALKLGLDHAEKGKVFVIGGERIYRACLVWDFLDAVYQTVIHGQFDCDTHFPLARMNGSLWTVEKECTVYDDCTTFKWTRNSPRREPEEW